MHQTTRLLSIVMASLVLTACDAEATLGSAEQRWLWLVAPLLGFALLSAVLVYLRWRMHRDLWDLGRDRLESPVRAILLTAIVLGLLLAVAFAVYNLRLEIDPRQKLWNIGLWFLGTVLGTAAALVLGLGPKAPST